MIICPRCQKRYSVMDNIGDFVCECSNNPEASDIQKEEDILVIGSYEDYSGSSTEKTNFYRGSENKVQGTDTEINGVRTHDYTANGNIKTLYRQRPHHEYIDLSK